MKKLIWLLLLYGCGDDPCISDNYLVTFHFTETSGNCGSIPSFSQKVSELAQCESIVEQDECNYELLDYCPNSYEELYLDFSTNTGAYYLETESCISFYKVSF